MCVVFPVFSDTMRYSQWAGGTHPTGMHSCIIIHVLAIKRSLGQGNIFRSVCQEFCPRGGGGSAARGRVGACSRVGGSAAGGCLIQGDGAPPWQLLLRAVRILLECILITHTLETKRDYVWEDDYFKINIFVQIDFYNKNAFEEGGVQGRVGVCPGVCPRGSA